MTVSSIAERVASENAPPVEPTPPAAPAAAPPTPTVKVSIKVSGTRKSGFRFQCGGLDQHALDIAREFTHDQAKRIAEFVVAVVNEK